MIEQMLSMCRALNSDLKPMVCTWDTDDYPGADEHPGESSGTPPTVLNAKPI